MKIYFIFFICALTAAAQNFTKVTEGAPVNDGGDSRSVNWIDYDNDGDLDLFVTNSLKAGEDDFFYINDGKGNFIKSTSYVITKDGAASDGSSWGDYDNDGYDDMVMVTWYGQSNSLYRNENGKGFKRIDDSPVSLAKTYSETGSWGDVNNDGLLDLIIVNSEGNKYNILYINRGSGVLETVESEAASDNTPSRNADWCDYDGDGDADLFIANEGGVNNILYRNDGGSLVSVKEGSIANDGGTSHGSSWGDYDNDGDFDLFVANGNNENNFLYRNEGNGNFTRVMGGDAVNDGGSSFGSVWGDIDNDGDLDLYVTNAFGKTKHRNFLYINDGRGGLVKDTSSILSKDEGWSYGCAMGDYNGDGWLDIFTARCYGTNENNSLYRNKGGGNKWLLLNLEGSVSNRSAIGAVVKVKSRISGNEVTQMRQVSGQSGYCGQTLEVHFGVGDAQVIEEIVIMWPSGKRTILTDIEPNRKLTVKE